MSDKNKKGFLETEMDPKPKQKSLSFSEIFLGASFNYEVPKDPVLDFTADDLRSQVEEMKKRRAREKSAEVNRQIRLVMADIKKAALFSEAEFLVWNGEPLLQEVIKHLVDKGFEVENPRHVVGRGIVIKWAKKKEGEIDEE